MAMLFVWAKNYGYRQVPTALRAIQIRGKLIQLSRALQGQLHAKINASSPKTTGLLLIRDLKSQAAIAKRASEKGPTPDQTGVSTFRWPAKGRVVSKFGSKKNGSPNDGIDISVPVGTAVKATENGTVIYAGAELEEFGKLILVRHKGGWVSAYAHSSKNLVARGDTVRRGQTIARSGRSGTATIPKIHFELRKNSNPVNPLKHLKRS